MNKERATQRRVFRAFRRAYVTGRKARYLQFLCVEYRELKGQRNAKARRFCKYYEQAAKIYRCYHKEFMVATEAERYDFEREVIGGITRARA